MDNNFEIDRSLYDNPTKTEYNYISEPGLSEKIIKNISKLKNEPDWMLKKRLDSYRTIFYFNYYIYYNKILLI